MREDFLHFLWRQARFNLQNLQTTTGQSLSIQDFGQHNKDAGPDFSGGQIRLDGLQWAGNIEIHVKASDWYAHNHHEDAAYDNVVLHVVLEEDRPVYLKDGQRIPCLELKGRIPPNILNSYWRLQHNEYWIPCQNQLHLVGESTRQQVLQKVLSERLATRAKAFSERLVATNKDWEEAFYQLLARALGGRVNADAMDMLARSIPLRILLKHKHSLIQLEALLFGQSGLLPASAAEEAAYLSLLRREYALLRVKHNLRPLPAAAWRYLRLRPNNFPTVRIAQLAAMLHRTGQLFGKTLAVANATELSNMFEVKLSNYWRTHYRFGKGAKTGERRLGTSTIHSIIINTVAPALLAYGNTRLDDRYRDRAVKLLQELPAEDNQVVRRWRKLGCSAKNAAGTQALLQLKTEYCSRSRCLVCAIGCQVLNQPYGPTKGPLLSVNETTAVYALAQDL